MSLAKTYLQDIRVKYPSNLDRDELRVTQTGMLTAVMEMTRSQNSIISPDLIKKAQESQGLNLDIPVMKKGIVTINNVRSCSVAGGQSASDMIRVVWKTASADILMVPAQYEKNEIKKEWDFAQKINEVVEAFKVAIEDDLDTAMDTNKTAVYRSPIVGTKYTLTAGAIQVTTAQQNLFFNDVPAINFADDFNYPIVKVIASHTVMPVVSFYINQGTGNNTNTQFQFGNFDFRFSNRTTVGAGKIGTGYFMPDGTIGLLTRVDVDARMGSKATDGTQWFQDTLSNLPFPVGVKYSSECSDQSALEAAGLTHLKATMVEHWQISFDYAILTPYNSDPVTKPGAIRKFELVA